jgi:transposase
MAREPSNLPTDVPSFRRVEALSRTPRRRRWSAEEKAEIVAESVVPGAVARQGAFRHGLHRNQLYARRRETTASEDGARAPSFVPVNVASDAAAASPIETRLETW